MASRAESAAVTWGKGRYFCRKNMKLWTGALIAASLGVLGFAIWWERTHRIHSNAKLHASGTSSPMNSGVAPTTNATATSTTLRATAPTITPGRSVQRLQGAFNRAADVIRPCVVNINAVRPAGGTAQKVPAQKLKGTRQPSFIDPFDGVPDKVIGNIAYESVGSGVIVDSAGYVITNHHLVKGATSIVVSRYNRTAENLPATLVASDAASDLALLKLSGAGPFPAAQLSDSRQVEVGDWVLAVGNPFGLQHTVTSGIVSGRREAMAISGVIYRGLLQTDAPINRGSSGGPLVNVSGQVIGINTAIYAPTGVFNGTGFAIPSNSARKFALRTINGASAPAATAPLEGPTVAPGRAVAMGRVARPAASGRAKSVMAAGRSKTTRLGIQGVDLTPGLARKLGLPPGQQGVFVNSVARGSPAARAGIQRGDVLLTLGGQPITGTAGLRRMLARQPAGRRVAVTLSRSGRTRTALLRLDAAPARGLR